MSVAVGTFSVGNVLGIWYPPKCRAGKISPKGRTFPPSPTSFVRILSACQEPTMCPKEMGKVRIPSASYTQPASAFQAAMVF